MKNIFCEQCDGQHPLTVHDGQPFCEGCHLPVCDKCYRTMTDAWCEYCYLEEGA